MKKERKKQWFCIGGLLLVLLLLACCRVFAEDTPMLTVDPQGGLWRGSTQKEVLVCRAETEQEIPIPEREHYICLGWTVDGTDWQLTAGDDTFSADGTAQEIDVTQTATLTVGQGDVTLTARWKGEDTAVTCVDRSGEETLGTSEKTYAYGDTASGGDWGQEETGNYYYEGYVYTGCTQEQVTGHTVVYRDFQPCFAFAGENYFLIEGDSAMLGAEQAQAVTYTSSAPEVVQVEPETGKMTGKTLGKAVITLSDGDGTALDQITVYCYRPTSYYTETTGVEAYPRVLHTTNESSPQAQHDYVIFSQYHQNNTYVRAHGCALCCLSEICQGYGVDDVTPNFLHKEGIAAVAEQVGVTIDRELTQRPYSRPLGFYGMQQVLASVGISSELVYNWEDETEAVDEVTQNLSLGRPVVVIIADNKWNGIQLASGYHFILLTGIDEEGYVMNVCSSSCKVESTKKSPSARLTVSQLLAHYLPKTKVKNDKDFFYHMPSGSGTLEFLKVTCDTPDKRTLNVYGDGVQIGDCQPEPYNYLS